MIEGLTVSGMPFCGTSGALGLRKRQLAALLDELGEVTVFSSMNSHDWVDRY